MGSKRIDEDEALKSAEEWMMRETTFFSTYPIEDHWMYGLCRAGYELSCQHDIDDNQTIYRYELDESTRKDSCLSHFINIIIRKDQDTIRNLGGSIVREKRNKKSWEK